MSRMESCLTAALGGMGCPTTDTVFPQPLSHVAAYAAFSVPSTAVKRMSVARTQLVRLLSPGTFAWVSNLSFAGMDFKRTRMKYRAAMFFEAERSQL